MDSKRIKNGLFLATLAGALLIPNQQLIAADSEETLLLPGIGMEKVLNDYYLSGIEGEIEEYLVPTVKGEYLDMGFADVEEGSFLYIRSEPSKDSEWVGKLYRDFAAKLAGPVGEWTKIESGSVTGYVKTEYLITGNAAQQKAEELIGQVQLEQEPAANTDTKEAKEEPIQTDEQPGEMAADQTEEQAADSQQDLDQTEEQAADSQQDLDQTEEQAADSRKMSDQAENQLADDQQAKEKADNQSTESRQASDQMNEESTESKAADTNKAKASFSYAESKEEEAARIAAAAEQKAKEEASASQAAAQNNAVTQTPVSSGSGQAVVDYACQFIGNPYVWGGTSLTNGADCSGFVQSVYANFGVSLPRTTWDMENAGVGISYDQAIPGDIILYDGHVGIYMGNGQIVNAIDDAHGIGVTSATYTNIITVRRLL